MTEVLQLPTQCNRLVPLDTAVVAAVGPSAVYFIQLPPPHDSAVPKTLASVDAPGQWGCCAPWHPPGGPLQRCGVFYEQSGRVLFRSCHSSEALRPHGEIKSGKGRKGSKKDTGREEGVVDLAVEGLGNIEEMAVFFGKTLAVRTATEVVFFSLDPKGSSMEVKKPLPFIGRTVLPQSESVDPTTVAEAGPTGLRHFMGASLQDGVADGDDHCICVASFNKNDRKLEALLLSVSATRVVQLRRTKTGSLTIPLEAGKFLGFALDWSKRQLVVAFKGKKRKASGGAVGLSLDSMRTSPTSIAVPSKVVGLTCTTDGDAWALTAANEDGVPLIKNLMAGDTGREVLLPSLRDIGGAPHNEEEEEAGELALASVGSTLCALYGKAVAVVASAEEGATRPRTEFSEANGTAPPDRGGQAGGEQSLYAWLLKQQQRADRKTGQEWHQQELRDITAFLEAPVDKPPAFIIRDCRYVSQHDGEFRHDVLDSIRASSKKKAYYKQLLRYVAVAQSFHPATILRALSVTDPSVRLSVAALLAVKPALAAGGVRLLEWAGPARAHFKSISGADGTSDGSANGGSKNNPVREAKLFGAALLNSALTALSAGALGAVEVFCAVADIALMTALTPGAFSPVVKDGPGNLHRAEGHNGRRWGSVTREEEEAELSIVECIAVLSNYARWALVTAAPSLGVITAYLAPPRSEESRRKEAMIRDRVAHAITTSRDVQIEVFPLHR